MSARGPKKMRDGRREMAREAQGGDALTHRARMLEEITPRSLPPWSPAPASWPDKIWVVTLIVGPFVFAATHRTDNLAWKGASVFSGLVAALALFSFVVRRRAIRVLREGRVVVGVVGEVARYLGKTPRVVLTIRYALDGERHAKISVPDSVAEGRSRDVARLEAGARVLLAVDPARPSAPELLDIE